MLHVPPPLRIDQWTEQYRYLSPEAAAEPGRYKIDRAEYQRGIMQTISDASVPEVVLMCSAQVGKTEILLNTIGYFMHYEPAPILAVQPTLDMAQGFSKERLANMIRDCPCLTDLVKSPRSRDSGNTMLHKVFPQGHITICGANSPSGLASRPIRVVLLDEVDRYPPSAGSEGDPVRLAMKRSKTFWNRKTVMVSTPTIKDASRIEAAFLESDQRYFYVPCPKCEYAQVFKWKQVVWTNDDPDTAKYKCENCSYKWSDSERWEQIKHGHWKAKKECRERAGFHLNEIYSSWTKLSEMVSNFLEAKKFPETLKTFVNTALGESWEDQGEGIEDIPFMKRREYYTPDFLPNKVLVLTAGIDVQDDRLEVEVVGWGFDEESWGVEYQVLYGDPSTLDLWARLDEFLYRTYKRGDGIELGIATAAIDSGGHYTQAVYNFCRRKRQRRICAIKGQAGQGVPVWPKKASVRNIGRVPLYSIGVDSVKDIIFARLRIENPGPGYCHFPQYDQDYFEQLTAEKVMISYKKGIPVRSYKQIKRRNEALDCRVYAYASFVGLQANLKRIKAKQDKAIEEGNVAKPNIYPAPEKQIDEPAEVSKGDKTGHEKTQPVENKIENTTKTALQSQAKKSINKAQRPRGNFVNSWRT